MHLWWGERDCQKIVLLFVFLFYICGVSFAQQAVTIDTAIQTASDYLITNLPRNYKVAILNIESDTPKVSMHIMEELSALLVNDRSLVLVERNDLNLIQQEENFQMSGEVSDETAQRIGRKLGAQTIISGSFVQIGSQYRMRIRAISVETAQVQAITSIPVKMDRTLRGLVQSPDDSGNNNAFDSLHDRNRLYLGARGGLSLGFYGNGGGLIDKTVYPSQTLNGIPSYNGALYLSVPIWALFTIQTEALITNDTFELLSGKTSLMTVTYTSFMIPLLAKLVYRPSIFTVQGYGGAYLSLPMGQMHVKHSNGFYSANFSLVPGFMAGGGFGIKLGPGYVMSDIRYASDFSNVTASYNGKMDVSRRSKIFFALGYEIGLISRK
jgi:TolB-like protein